MFKPPHFFPLALSLVLFSTSPSLAAADENSQVPSRDQISAEYKWHLEDIYANDAAWEADYDKVKKQLPKIAQYKGKLAASSKSLLECLTLRDQISMTLEKLFPYARMHQDENTGESKYQALTGKAHLLASEASTACAFIEPEILAMPEKQLLQFRQQETGLKVYSYYLDKLSREKQHVLSPSEEELLSGMSQTTQTPSKVFNMLSSADMRFPDITDEQGKKVTLSEGRYSTYLRSYDRQVRQQAFTGLLGTYSQYRNTLAATLDGQVKQHVFFAKARKYASPLEAALSGNDIPVEVYDNLISTVNNHLAPLHRYVALKKKALGVDQIHMYDLYVPLAKDVEIKVPYQEGLQLVRQSLAPLGDDYAKQLNKGLSSGWIDVYENKGKRSGAYSWGVYGVHPFVLLNYNDRFGDVSTVAHEMGHALHSYYSQANQPYPTSDYVIFTAETASTTNEILLIDYMLKNTKDKKEKLYLLNQYLENIRTTVYRQTMFAEFEKIIHEKSQQGETLTADVMESIYHDLNVKYFGPGMVIDKEIDIEWARIPHFYNNFYVYQYATGYSAATALAEQVQKEGKPAQERYINNFLKAGGSDAPIAILKRAGVDMSSPEPIEITLKKFNSLLDELEQLLADV